MFTVLNRVPVAEGWEETFEERFRRRAGQIDKQPGFLHMQVLKPHSDDSPYVVLTSWRDKSAFDAWVGSDDFKLAHSNPLPAEAFAGQGKLEMYEVIVASKGSA
jgi:heme-degrading monooxygenase HmoA